MTKTENYQLNQWEPTDKLSRADFNADNATIDAALAAKAEKSAVTAVETALANYKTANDAAVAKKAETSTVTALQQSVAAMAANLGSAGKTARIAWGSYTGDGTYGEDNPTTLTFGFYPIVVIVGSDGFANYAENPSVLVRGRTKSHGDRSSSDNSTMNLTWTDNGVSYHASKAFVQNNYVDHVYCYVAIGYDKSAEAA